MKQKSLSSSSFDSAMIAIIAVLTVVYFTAKELEKYIHAESSTIIFVLLILSYFIYSIFFKQDKVINNLVYPRRPWEAGSFPNFFGQTQGQRWTPSRLVKQKMKGDIFIDRFRFSQAIKNRFAWIPFLNKKFENFDCYIDAKNLTKSGVVIGKMGGGKSEFYFSLIKNGDENKTFNRYVIYDPSGDFIAKFYREGRDIIANIFDARGAVWDIFKEMETHEKIFSIFLTNLFSAIAGDKKDFFSGSSQQRYDDLVNAVHFKTQSLTSREKWQLFVDKLDEYFNIVMNSANAQNSEKDIIQTMKVTIQTFKYINYLIQNNAETFTFQDFLEKKNQKKLFLNYVAADKSQLEPYFSGLLASFFSILLSQKQRKEDLTLLALDEYFGFAKNIDKNLLTEIHTQVRKFGGIMLPAIQSIKESDKELADNVLPNAEFFFIFGGTDNYTLTRIEELVGKARYKAITQSDRENGDSYTTQAEEIFNRDYFHTLGERFEHFTICLSKRILYLAYTPAANLQSLNESFVRSEKWGEFQRYK